MELGQGAVEIEPVVGLTGHDHVDTAVRKRNRLGCAFERLRLGHCGAQLVEHLRAGLDCDDVRAELHEPAG